MEESRLSRAAALIESDPDETNRICIELLAENPDNPKALYLMAKVLAKAEKHGLAYNLLKRVTELAPKQAAAWCDLGMCADAMLRPQEARKHFERAVSLDPNTYDYQSNLSMVDMQEGKFADAMRRARAVLAKDPQHVGAQMANGFASLALHDWRPGWIGYSYTLGGKYRNCNQYNDEPIWDGTPTDTLVVYGEQGLGDEIMYASCVPSITGAQKVVIDCDHRLEGLFRRSFAQCRVYGTRRERVIPWLDQHNVTASIPLGGLPLLYRNTDGEFTRKPFLVADPAIRLQWRALFDSWGKRPKIGIAWTGGRKHTGAKRREVGLEAFRPLIEALDADFISLQYKDPSAEIEASGLPIKHFKRACQTEDYDDLAGMVAELDLVIGIHTAALHLAGGLGVKTIALVPSVCSCIYYGDEMLWYPPSYRIHRQKAGEKWADVIRRVDHGYR